MLEEERDELYAGVIFARAAIVTMLALQLGKASDRETLIALTRATILEIIEPTREQNADIWRRATVMLDEALAGVKSILAEVQPQQ